jgi:hypothetical protein
VAELDGIATRGAVVVGEVDVVVDATVVVEVVDVVVDATVVVGEVDVVVDAMVVVVGFTYTSTRYAQVQVPVDCKFDPAISEPVKIPPQ